MNDGPKTPGRTVYTGNSMRGVFMPGETLALAETAFETLRTGDVVVMLGRNPYIVHRIVEKNAEYAVTMGDNNDRPDAERLMPDDAFRLVTGAFSADGTLRTVEGGEVGMKRFRCQQRNRKLRRFVGRLIRPLKPLGRLRIPARTMTKFRDGTVQWSCAGIPVAARSPSGRTVYLHWSKRLFFRIPAERNKNGRLD